MERTWAYAALLGVSMLWAGGFGEAFWRAYRVRPGVAAAFGVALGMSAWAPPRGGVSVGAWIAGVAAVGLVGRVRWRLPLVAVAGAAAVWLVLERMALSSPPAWPPLVMDALALGLTAGLGAAEPVTALSAVVAGAALATLAQALGLPGPAPGSRAMVARLIVGALSAWAVGYASARRKRPTIGQGGRRWP